MLVQFLSVLAVFSGNISMFQLETLKQQFIYIPGLPPLPKFKAERADACGKGLCVWLVTKEYATRKPWLPLQ